MAAYGNIAYCMDVEATNELGIILLLSLGRTAYKDRLENRQKLTKRRWKHNEQQMQLAVDKISKAIGGGS